MSGYDGHDYPCDSPISGFIVDKIRLNSSLFDASSLQRSCFICMRCVGIRKQAGQLSPINGRHMV